MKIRMGKWKNLFAQNKGWILVDLLIGTIILSVGLVALMGAFTQAGKSTVNSRNRLQAVSIAQQQLENLKKYSSSADLPTTTGTTTTNGIYTVQLQRLTIPALASVPKLIPVQVTLTWQEQGGAGPVTQTVQIVEYILTN